MSYSLGVIGGSGLYEMEGLEIHEERAIETPFGDPSDDVVLGELSGRRVAFLTRHGKGHRLLPSELNFRANLYALKTLGQNSLKILDSRGGWIGRSLKGINRWMVRRVVSGAIVAAGLSPTP